ncbi:MAG: 5'-nucleotidase/UDP-sugar diphosphatase [Candidatus Paceibacteria bacterium]|jgi:5'-nucleotidase/UDP-sugar diphosphatase
MMLASIEFDFLPMNPLKLSPRSAQSLGLACFLAACLFAFTSAGTADRYHVVLLHTNDMHGQVQPRPATWIDRENPPGVGGLPRLGAMVNKLRAEAAKNGSGFLLVDGGDWFQGTPEGMLGGGLPFVEAMQLLRYDAMAVGNHEFDHGVDALATMISKSGVPALSANVFVAAGGERVDWCEPYRLLQVGEMRVAIVGLLTPSTPSITHRDASELHFQSPADALAQVKSELESKVDWILPITHLGVTGDRRLAKAHPDLGLIVGGHSHTYLKQGVEQGKTLIVQSGSKASALGRVDLWFDSDTWELLESKSQMVDLLGEPSAENRNEPLDELCAELVARSEREMNVVVGQLGQPLVRNFKRTQSSPGGNLIVDAMRSALDADIAFQNRGGIRCDLKQGEVTRRGLFELLPFGNHLVLLEVSGADLRACLRASVEGTAHTGLEVSGMRVLWSQEEGGYRLEGLEIAGEKLDPTRKYKLATNNFLAGGGDGYDILKKQKPLREDPRMMRDMLEERFRSADVVSLPADNRYSEVQK